MNIEQIIFNIMKSNAHNWVRYWLNKEISGLTAEQYSFETIKKQYNMPFLKIGMNAIVNHKAVRVTWLNGTNP